MSVNIQNIDTHVDLLQSLLWQHNNAPKLTALVQQKQAWYNLQNEAFWNDWLRDVFDLRTANDFGLKVWSVILGMPVNIVTAAPASGSNNFGFGTYNKNFNHGTFGQRGSTTASLTREDARLLLRLRYFQLICRPTLPEINRFLRFLFADRDFNVAALDPFNMTYIIYAFDSNPGQQLLDILSYFDVLPRPAGVGVQFQIGAKRKAFGFGADNLNFNNGTFSGE